MASRTGFTRLFLRSLFIQGSWNYRGLLDTGLEWALLPRVEATDPESGESAHGIQAAEPFNSHPYLATIALGAVTRAEQEGVDPLRIRSFRQALRSPLGGLGDALVWGAWRPVCLVAAVLAFLAGIAPLLVIGGVLVLYNGVHLALRLKGLRVGLELGLRVATGIRAMRLPLWAERIRGVGVLLVGLLLGMLWGRGGESLGWSSGWLLGAAGLVLAGLAAGERLRRWGPVLLVGLVLTVMGLSASGTPPSATPTEETVQLSDSVVEERRVHVRNQLGLHARPAAEFVKIAARFQAEIHLSKEGLTVNGKSIMGVLMLAAERGTELVIRGEGSDAAAAVEALGGFVDQGFRET